MLWSHQAAAVEELLRSPRYGLWWEPGVGKTAPWAVAGRRLGGRQLWLTKASLRKQAAAEIARFRGDGATIQVVSSGRAWIDPRAHVVVCSFEMVRTKPMLKQLMKIAWRSVVVDEAHSLASPGAKVTQAIYGHRPSSRSLASLSPFVWVGTGTPIVNYPNDLWTHVSRLWPRLCEDCPKHADWRDKFCEVANNGFGLQVVGGRNLDELARRFALTGSRLKLVEARDMPPLVIDTLPLDGAALDLSSIPPELLAQVSEACGLDVDLEPLGMPSATLRRLLALGKEAALAQQIIAEIEGGLDRVLVFGCHVAALQSLAHRLHNYGAGLVIGSTPERQREAAIGEFDAGRSRILVGNIEALGTGRNLQSCRRIIFLDASWSPAKNGQAIGRCYRAGQARSVHVTFSSLANTIDDKVQAALVRKARVIRLVEGSHVDPDHDHLRDRQGAA